MQPAGTSRRDLCVCQHPHQKPHVTLERNEASTEPTQMRPNPAELLLQPARHTALHPATGPQPFQVPCTAGEQTTDPVRYASADRLGCLLLGTHLK